MRYFSDFPHLFFVFHTHLAPFISIEITPVFFITEKCLAVVETVAAVLAASVAVAVEDARCTQT